MIDQITAGLLMQFRAQVLMYLMQLMIDQICSEICICGGHVMMHVHSPSNA